VNGIRNLLLVLMFGLAAVTLSSASATDVYITQSGSSQGACSGAAHPPSWFNSGANWGSSSAQIGPGTTVHLCGTITSELQFQGGGASGNVVELLFENGASIQITPGCDSNGCVNLGGNSYILIDGGAGQACGWNTANNNSEGACNGKIENMLYGSSNGQCPGGTCTKQADSSVGNLIYSAGGSNIEVRNLQIGPSYVHTSTGAGSNDSGGTQGIYLNNTNVVNIHDSKCRDAVWCLVLGWGGNATYSSWSVTNNELFNDSHMTAYAGSGSATLNGLTMSGNYCHDMSNWDTSGDDNHANCIHLYGASGSNTYTNVTINNNIMGGNPGANMTAQIFIEAQNSNASNVAIFNNLLYAAGGLQGGERLMLLNDCTSATCNVVNNTFSGNSTSNGTCEYIGGNGNTKTQIVKNGNNAVTNCYTLFDSEISSYQTLDYNGYGTNSGETWRWNGTFYAPPLSGGGWMPASGEGSHSLYASNGLSLDSSYKPGSGSTLISTGVNLTSLCSGKLAALCSDLAGNPRPSSGSWTIGAYESNSSVGAKPGPPSGLAAVVQ